MKRETQKNTDSEENVPLYSTPDNLTDIERRYFFTFSDFHRKLQRNIRKKIWLRRIDFLYIRIKALLWILAAIYAICQSNFFHIIFIHPAVNKYFKIFTK